ncbi:MAG: hypothetical protein Q7K26_02140 [bacterium]|nr:hypothetical protein [bacterium]
MAISTWDEDKSLGAQPCSSERDSWQCPNMSEVDGDTSMTHEHYECAKCGRRVTLDYDEMK